MKVELFLHQEDLQGEEKEHDTQHSLGANNSFHLG